MKCSGDQNTNSDTSKREALLSDTEAVVIAEHQRHRLVEQVDDTVDETVVCGCS